MDKINYNITNLSIDDGLANYPISAGKNYLILLEAPTNANVTVRLNNNTSDEIPLDKNFALKFPKSTQIYISADTVAGETIKIGTSASLVDVADFEIIPSPLISDIDSIGTVTKLGDRFAPTGTAIQQTITAGSSYTFTKASQKMIRYHGTDELGVELNSNSIKYPIYEDILYLDNISTVEFHNDNTASIVLTIWEG